MTKPQDGRCLNDCVDQRLLLHHAPICTVKRDVNKTLVSINLLGFGDCLSQQLICANIHQDFTVPLHLIPFPACSPDFRLRETQTNWDRSHKQLPQHVRIASQPHRKLPAPRKRLSHFKYHLVQSPKQKEKRYE